MSSVTIAALNCELIKHPGFRLRRPFHRPFVFSTHGGHGSQEHPAGGIAKAAVGQQQFGGILHLSQAQRCQENVEKKKTSTASLGKIFGILSGYCTIFIYV